MQVVRIEKVDEITGMMTVELMLSKEQTQVLMEYALSSLVSLGLVTYVGAGPAAEDAANQAAQLAEVPEKSKLN
jgi:hypothetical protein